jgi:hypothetical protein
MSRRADPARIEAARRAAAIARLISAGEPLDRAVAWVDRWTSTLDGRPGRAAWEALDVWLARERSAGRGPPSSVVEAQPGRQEV